MKILVDEDVVCVLNETQEKVMKQYIETDSLKEDVKRRVHYIIMHKHAKCMERMRDEWTPKLKKNGVRALPIDDDEFAQLVFTQHNFKGK